MKPKFCKVFKIVHGRTYQRRHLLQLCSRQGSQFLTVKPYIAPGIEDISVNIQIYCLLQGTGKGKERFPGSCRTFDKNKRSRLCIHQKAFHNKCLSAVPVIYSKRFLVCLIQRIYPALKVSCQSHFPTGTDKLQELVLFQSNFFLRKTEKLFYRSPIIKDCTLP